MAFVAKNSRVKYQGQWFAPGQPILTADGKPPPRKDRERLEERGQAGVQVSQAEVQQAEAYGLRVAEVQGEFDEAKAKHATLRDDLATAREKLGNDNLKGAAREKVEAKVKELEAGVTTADKAEADARQLLTTLTGQAPE